MVYSSKNVPDDDDLPFEDVGLVDDTCFVSFPPQEGTPSASNPEGQKCTRWRNVGCEGSEKKTKRNGPAEKPSTGFLVSSRSCRRRRSEPFDVGV